MRAIDELTIEIQVGANPARSTVELGIAGRTGEAARVVHLSREEARRLAALILFQAARLDRSPEHWRLTLPHLRRSA